MYRMPLYAGVLQESHDSNWNSQMEPPERINVINGTLRVEAKEEPVALHFSAFGEKISSIRPISVIFSKSRGFGDQMFQSYKIVFLKSNILYLWSLSL